MADLPRLDRTLSAKLSDLRRLAREDGIDVHGLSPQEILQKVYTELTTQEGLTRILEGVSAPARDLLFDVAWRGEGILPGHVIEQHEGRSGREGRRIRELCEELRVKGLLFSLGYQDYWASRPGYVMTFETAAWAGPVEALRKSHADKERAFYVAREGQERAALGLEWLQDLVRVAAEVERRPAGITQGGTVYRRDVERLGRLLGPRDLAQESSAWRALGEEADLNPRAYGPWAEDAAPSLGLLLWLGLGLGLLTVAEGSVTAVRDWRARLGRRSPAEIWRRAVIGVWNLHVVDLIGLFWLRFLNHKDWLLPRRLAALARGDDDSLYAGSSNVAGASLLRCMAQLGALEVGVVEGEPAVRATAIGPAARGGDLPEVSLEGGWSILPSGDILVPPDVAPGRLAWLEGIARPAKVDVVCTYQVSQESLHSAVDHGLRADAILEELEAGSRTGLPQPLRFRIDEWLGRVGRYRFVEAAMLVCRTRADAQAALALPGVRRLVLEVLGDTCLVVPAAAEERVRAALAQGGMAALEGVLRPSGLLREDAFKEKRRGQRMLRSLDYGRGKLIEAL